MSLKRPIIGLAPMEGITDEPMRQIQTLAAKPDVIYTEFVSVEGLVRRPLRLLKKLTFQKNERPIVAQLFGVDPNSFARAAMIIKELGLDGLDLNFGCPARKVLRQKGGAALIGNYQLTDKIISACLKSKIPLSVKTRLAHDQKETLAWLKFLTAYPLSAICLHGRKISQLHAGPVNWELIAQGAKIAQTKKILFLGNGGVKTRSEAEEKCHQYGFDGVLIGQAALGNPWLFVDQSPTLSEIKKIILAHAHLAYNFYGPRGFSATRKHFLAYLRGLPHQKELKAALLTAATPAEIAEVLKL
ncbi:MAG: tRNA-dihydrouridine synthase [Candidatus Shapirobacteria bacterium]